MAIYHLHAQIISRGSGRSAVAASAYRSGEKLRENSRDITAKSAYNSGENLGEYDYTRKRGIVHTEIILPENAPQEFLNREKLWNDVEKSEKRKDAQLAREIDIALPIEFDRDEQIEIMRDYIKENFVKNGMCADFAIHDKQDGNPHAHIMLTTRTVSENGFEKKNRDWNKTEYLERWRKNWQNICNEKLHEKGLEIQIDCRTLQAQNIDREPTIHEGRNPQRIAQNRDIIERNKAKSPENTAKYLHEIKQGYFILDKEITIINQNKSIRQKINNALFNERETFLLEYHRQKLIAEISPNGLKIKEELKNLDKQDKPKNIDDKLFQAKSERMLDILTEEKFMKILEQVRPEQAEKLLQIKEIEKIKRVERTR